MKAILILTILFSMTQAYGDACLNRAHHQRIREGLGKKCDHQDKRFNCLDVMEVTDGDTLSVNIIGVHPYFAKDTSVRLFGLDTPESRPSTVKCLPTEAGDTELDREEYQKCKEALKLRDCEIKASKQATEILDQAICSNSDRIDIELATDDKGELIREKYGRVLGDILLVKYSGSRAQTTNAKDLLLGEKLAFKYDGGKKPTRDWCNKTIIRDPKLQKEYVSENFCSSRKCTEKTYQVRCHRRSGYPEQLTCYSGRIEDNIGRWFASCNRKSGKERRDCYQDKSENYFEFCRLFDSSGSAKNCRKDISQIIENYCSNELKGTASEDCSSVL